MSRPNHPNPRRLAQMRAQIDHEREHLQRTILKASDPQAVGEILSRLRTILYPANPDAKKANAS
jgi:hypothetical protein